MTALSTNNDEQMKLLEDALQVVRMHASQMRQCLDRGSLGRRHRHRAKYGLSRSGDNDDEHSDGDNDGEDDDESGVLDAIKHCSAMLGELRTSALTPKNYYELYLAVFDALQFLIGSLRDAHISGKHHLADLYELVQYAGNVVPRLYLMVTVGSALLGLTVAKRARAEQRNGDGADSNAATATSKADREDGDDDGDDVPVQEIMMDMLEMSRGVQHPTRGLFLRYYLDQMTKGSLAYADVDDAIYFTLTNFTEMNKLWVRLQHLGHSREREKRELERRELRTLVGSNLIRLASLERITLDHYKGKVLPHLLKQVVSCKDPLAQEYLMEAI
ncbi:retromer complex subunit Vps35, partial [Spiromyces aspiralis]